MSDTVATSEHVPPHSNWGHKLKIALGGLALIVPIGIGWAFWPSDDALEQLLRDYEFVPIKLPSKNYVPGSIVVVNESGRIKSTVCEPSQTVLENSVKDSPSTGVIRTQFSNSRFAFGANVIDRINQTLSGDAVRDVTLEFADVRIREIVGSKLKAIRAELLGDAACLQAVEELLAARKYVCQSSALFEATVSYRVAYDRRFAGAGEVNEGEIAYAVNQAAADATISGVGKQFDPAKAPTGAHTGGDATLRYKQVSSGENLNYGMRIHPLCLTLGGGAPIQLPSTDLEKFVVWARGELPLI